MCNRILQQKLSLGEGRGGESVECQEERGREGTIPLRKDIQKKKKEVRGQGKRLCVIILLM